MKHKLQYLLLLPAVAAALAIFGSLQVHANTSLQIPKDLSDSTTTDQRVSERKETFKAQLENVSPSKVSSKCKASQAALVDVRSKDQAVKDKRQKAYTDLASKLESVVGKLEAQKVDAPKLAGAQSEIYDAITVYLDDSQKYMTALGDLGAMECEADPMGFYATLIEARQLRKSQAEDVAAIKAASTKLVDGLNEAKQNLLKGETQ